CDREVFLVVQRGERLLVAQAGAWVGRITGVDNSDWKILVDERVGSMLHFTRWIPFGVNIRDFFELQRAFERNRIMDPASKEAEILRPHVLFRQIFTFFFVG